MGFIVSFIRSFCDDDNAGSGGGKTISALVEHLTWTDFDASVYSSSINAIVEELTWTDYAATVSKGNTVNGLLETLTWTDYAADVFTAQHIIEAILEELAWADYAASVVSGPPEEFPTVVEALLEGLSWVDYDASVTIPSPDRPTTGLVWTANHESGTMDDWLGANNGFFDASSNSCCGQPGSYDIISNDFANGGPSAARRGNYALKLQRLTSQPQPAGWNATSWNRVTINAIGSDWQSTESIQSKYQKDEWLGISMYLPSWVTVPPETSWNMVFGWHGKHSYEPTYLTIQWRPGNIMDVYMRYSEPGVDLHDPYWYNQGWWNPGITAEIVLYSGPMLMDQWVDFVWHTKVDAGAGGRVECWRNGTQIVNYTGPMGFYHSAPNVTAGYFYVSTYYGWPNNPPYDYDRALYFDEVRIARDTVGGVNLFDVVDPAYGE